MVLELKKIARDLKIKLPDLITRPVGRRMYERVCTMLGIIKDAEVVVIDFDGISVIDSSFIDEFLLRLIINSRENSPAFFVKLKNFSNSMEMNIEAVLKSYHAYNQERIAVMTDGITANNAYFIGNLTALEKDVVNFLRVNKISTLDEISAITGLSHEETGDICRSLYGLRLVRLADESAVRYMPV